MIKFCSDLFIKFETLFVRIVNNQTKVKGIGL